MISGLPRPLPECGGCGDPMARAAFVESGGKCTGCLTLAETLQRVHNRRRLAQVTEAAGRRAQARIDALAAKRLGRQKANA